MFLKTILRILGVVSTIIGYTFFILLVLMLFADDYSAKSSIAENKIVNLGGNYQYDANIPGKISGPGITIPALILNYAVDDTFIIVKQLPCTGNTQVHDKKCADTNIASNPGIKYWIINKMASDDCIKKTIGPMNFREFEIMKDSLHIELSFDLDDSMLIETQNHNIDK